MRKNVASLAFGAISLFLLLGSSCSLVYNLDPDQCSSNADCVGRFGRGYTCDLGICKSDDASTGGKAGSTGGSGGATAGTGEEAGKSGKGGTGGKPASSGGGGMAGSDEPECATHNDCFMAYDDSNDNPRACVDGACVPLMTDDCPIVLPSKDMMWNALKSSNAIILGGFAPLSGTTLNTYGRNYDLPVQEFSTKTGGVYAGSTKRRQVVVVLCNMLYNTQDKLLAPAKHLMEELKVPGVDAALLLEDQQYIWENVARDNGVFMMMPGYSSQALIDANDDGLIWNMLSGANKLSVSYQPLLDMTVQHLKSASIGALGATEDLKVAHVKATDEGFLVDTAAYLESNLTFNGKSTNANLTAGTYKPIEITSAYKAPADPQTDAINAILAFGPHVVIGSTVTEMLQYIIPGVESGWATSPHASQKRPFYLLGALTYNDTQMAPLISGVSTPAAQKPLFQRILGVNWPAAVDQTVYEDYQARWVSAYGARQDGYENFYDSMYYLLYSVAASSAPLTGKRIAAGLDRVSAIGSKIPEVDVGPNDVLKSTNSLSNDSDANIELVGAGGPPNWDVHGARNDPASVWCVDALGAFQRDQLRYDPDTSTLQPSDTTLSNSEIKCFSFPAQ